MKMEMKMKPAAAAAAAAVRFFAIVVVVMYTASCVQTSIVDYEEDDEIIVLNETNFDTAVREFKYLFVEFYAPWCSHCKKLQPEYTRAAQLLNDNDIAKVRLAKVDATEEKKLAERFNVRGYPTLKLFRAGSTEDPVECKVEHRAESLIAWLRKKVEMPFIQVDDLESAKKLMDDLDVVVFGFFKDMKTAGAKAFAEVADSVDDVVFAVTSKDELFNEYSATDNSVVVFKKFDEGRVDLTGSESLTVDAINQLVDFNQLPVVIEFNDETAPRIFARSLRRHVLLFISKDSSKLQLKLDEFKQVGAKFKGKALFIYVDVDPNSHKRVLDFFGLKRAQCPTYRMFELDGSLKYKPDDDELDPSELEQFVNDVLAHRREPHLMSEKIPADWDAKPVKELVGKNFYDVVDRTKDVVVEFYAPWCSFCKELVPTWEELGEKYKDSEDVIIAKIDATTNEVSGIKIANFPSIKFFSKDTGEALDFPSSVNKTLDNLVKFIELKGIMPVEEPDSTKNLTGEETKKKDEL